MTASVGRLRVWYVGAERDDHGMPIPHYSYLILGSDWRLPGSGIASVVSLSGAEETDPGKVHHLALYGGPRRAIDLAEQYLDRRHSGLTKHRSSETPSLALVTAWCQAIFPRLLEALHQEEAVLKDGNPTWRFRARRCEFVRPVPEYVRHDHAPLFEQFLRLNTEVESLVRSHDASLRAVEDSAEAVRSALVSSEAFLEIVRAIDAEDPSWRGAYPPQDGPSLLAESAVNWSRTPRPEGRTNASAWERHGARVLALRRASTDLDQAFARLEHEVPKLRATSNELAESLRTLRNRLADELELPAVPVEPAAPVQEVF